MAPGRKVVLRRGLAKGWLEVPVPRAPEGVLAASAAICKLSCAYYYERRHFDKTPALPITYGPEGQKIGDCAKWCSDVVLGDEETCDAKESSLRTTLLAGSADELQLRCGFYSKTGSTSNASAPPSSRGR